MPDGSVVTLDIGVLLGLTRLDVLDGNPLLFGPFQQLATDVFRVIIDPDCPGFSSPFDDAIKV